jgi:hypothetical protein
MANFPTTGSGFLRQEKYGQAKAERYKSEDLGK